MLANASANPVPDETLIAKIGLRDIIRQLALGEEDTTAYVVGCAYAPPRPRAEDTFAANRV